MTLPYKPILSDLVKGRVDFNKTHAGKLYSKSAVAKTGGQITSATKSLWSTHCSGNPTYFKGKSKKYKRKKLHQRDKQNKHISHGRIAYQYGKKGSVEQGCRVKASMVLRWKNDDGKTVKVKPKNWVYDNFIRQAESYWSIDKVFTLKLWLKGHNDSKFKSIAKLVKKKDDLTVRFATKFLPHNFNQMYKSNPLQFYNFSTMTTDGTHRHEVGHAFGLDDEYGKHTKKVGYKKNGCKYSKYGKYAPLTYQMCKVGVSDKRTIYHYIAVSRYVLK